MKFERTKKKLQSKLFLMKFIKKALEKMLIN